MHHYFEAITNTSGDSLVGYFGRVINRANNNTVALASDDNGTPIIVVSGVENMAKTDDFGNLDFYVEPGTYDLEIYAPNATSLIMRVANVAMSSSKGDRGDPGPEGPQGQGLADVMAPTGAGLVGFKQASTAAVTRTVLAKQRDTVSPTDFGANGNGTNDDTAACQAAIDATFDGGALVWPAGAYAITTLDSRRCVTNWDFQQASFIGIATQPTDCMFRFRGLHSRIRNMNLNLNFNMNYTCALWWYNADESSQNNLFDGLEIRYGKRGIIYGAMPGATSTLFAQSENTLKGGTFRGMEKPLYNNHGNGFLFIDGGHLVAHDEDWATFGPAGGYDKTANRCFENIAGTLTLTGGEIQNTIDPLGNAADIMGGVVNVNGVITEVSVPFLVKNGQLNITGGRILNTQSVTPQFKIPTDAGTGAAIKCLGVRMERNIGVGGFSSQPLVENAGAPAIDMSFANCEIDDWTRAKRLVKDHAEKVRMGATKWVPNGSAPSDIYMLDTNAPDLLDRRDLDRTGITADGWFPFLFNGPFENLLYGLNDDVPNSSFPKSLAFKATKPASGDSEGGYFAADPTSLATLKQTAIRAIPGDRFMLEGWVRNVDAVSIGLAVAMFDATGALANTKFIVIASNGEDGFVDNTWRYVRQVCIVPPSNTAFIVPGVDIKNGEGRFCGLQLRRADWTRK